MKIFGKELSQGHGMPRLPKCGRFARGGAALAMRNAKSAEAEGIGGSGAQFGLLDPGIHKMMQLAKTL